MSNDADIELESQEFREALLTRLNGQSEGIQRLVKLTDTRFQSHARRMREHRQEHAKDRQKQVEERRRMERLVMGALAAAPGVTLGIVKAIEVLM